MPPTEGQYLNAAKKSPSSRSAYEQRLVDQGSNMQSVRNADAAAKQNEKVYGK